MKTPAALLSVLAVAGVYVGKPEVEIPAPKPIPQSASGVQAVISGLDTGTEYTAVPPAMVELDRLPRGAAVWIEVCRKGGKRGHATDLKAHFVPTPDGRALLPLPGLRQVCDGDGEWTVFVMTTGPGGTSTALARTTFHLRRSDTDFEPAL